LGTLVHSLSKSVLVLFDRCLDDHGSLIIFRSASVRPKHRFDPYFDHDYMLQHNTPFRKVGAEYYPRLRTPSLSQSLVRRLHGRRSLDGGVAATTAATIRRKIPAMAGSSFGW
jgi:hypothetical protein